MDKFSRILASIISSLGAIALLFVEMFTNKEKLGVLSDKISLIIYSSIALLLFIFIIINKKWIKTKFHKFVVQYFRYLFLDVNVESQNAYLEFLDEKGDAAIYTEENVYKKIRRNKTYFARIESEGKISDYVEAYNCSCNINHRRDEMQIMYGKFSYHNGHVRFKNKQYHFGYSLKLEDSFKGNKESWYTQCSHFTKLYSLNIIFHKNNRPRNIEIFEESIDGNGTPILKKVPINPLIIERRNSILVKVKLINLIVNQKFEICWEWN